MQIKTAMLLAAGRGQRLSPLTDTTPKPLLKIQGKPLIVHHIERLKKLSVEKIIINVSYLAEHIMDYLGDGTKYDLCIQYSYEPELLGAGGAVRQALPLLGEDPFLLISSDVFTDFPFEKFFVPEWHLEKNLFHAVVTDKENEQKGDFDLSEGKLFLSENPDYLYGSIAVIKPSIFASEPVQKANISVAFNKIVEQEKASGEYYKNIYNINTVDQYQTLA